MNYNPIIGCRASPFVINLRDTVRSIYNNYIYFQWQISNVGGTTAINTIPLPNGTRIEAEVERRWLRLKAKDENPLL